MVDNLDDYPLNADETPDKFPFGLKRRELIRKQNCGNAFYFDTREHGGVDFELLGLDWSSALLSFAEEKNPEFSCDGDCDSLKERSNKMANFLVTWQINIDADSELEAAKKAKEIQLDPESIANVFEIKEAEDWFSPEKVVIDLDNLEGKV